MLSEWVPHDYQKQAIKFMVGQGSAGLFLDPGLGKTSTTLAAFKVLKRQGLVSRALIVAPLRPALSVWPNEVAKWRDFSSLNLEVLHGKDKTDLLMREGADIDVVNYEGLGWLFAQAAKLPEWPWQMLVCDESTRLKCASTLRFKTLKPHLQKFKRRYILTGTPAPNGLLDLFGQIYVLDLGASLGRFITHYRTTYFDSVGYGGYTWVPRAGSEDAIYERLRPLVLRMSGEDYLKLPPLVCNTVDVELPEAARKIYTNVENAFFAEIEGGLITAANAAAASGKCRQVANGGAYLTDDLVEAPVVGARKWATVHDAKIEALKDILEELGGKPALVAYEFQHDLDRLLAAFPGTPYLGGGITAVRQREVEAAWNFGKLPLLFAQPQSVAHGLNLQGVGAAVVWFSLTWNLENYDQLIRRVWRQGQKERVVVHHLVAKKTVDEAVMKAIAKKTKVQGALLDALREYRAGGVS